MSGLSQSQSVSAAGLGQQAPHTAERGRMILLNVNGFTQERADEIKHSVESDQRGEARCAILILTELNVDWRESFKNIKEMTRWRCSRHVHFSHNTTERKGRVYQPGGVANLWFGGAAARVVATEADPTGLGRWCAVQYQLKDKRLWVLALYRPCLALGPDTVYQQHQRYLVSCQDSRDPRLALLEDVKTVVQRYRDQGHWVIVGGDFNEDVRNVRLPGLCEVITRFSPEPTYHRGSVPIDGFFASWTVPVNRGGLFPFYSFSLSDHTAVWFESLIFEQQPSRHPPIRRLTMGQPKVVDRYLSSLRRQWSLELPDSQATIAMVRAEKDCRKVYTGGLSFSPDISKSIILIRLWKLRLKRKMGKGVSVSLLKRLERKCGLNDGGDTLTWSVEVIQAGLSQAQERAKVLRRSHASLRYDHLRRLAHSRPELEGMVDRERARAVFRRLREAIPAKSRRPLFMVQDRDGSWKDTEDTIFHAVVEENRRRFTQTNQTPLRVEPLRSSLGDLGETDAVEEVLSGSFVAPEGSDVAFLDLLPFLKREASVVTLDIFSVEAFRRGWRKMKEWTGCQGPLHFGHFKAIAQDEALSQRAAVLLKDAFTSGVPVDRWLLGTDVMIEKKAGNYNVEQLRTILLFQPDFNFGNKLIGRAMMSQAERLGLMPEAQYGSRRSKSASLQLCNKVLLFELARMQLIPLGYCSTDAKSNYDRIIHSFAVLAMCRLGVPREVALCMFRGIQGMAHKVRTGFGDSALAYSSHDNDPFQGVGQGNGAGPAIWAAVSAPLFQYMDSRRKGVVFRSPLSGEESSVSCLAFVDDTDVIAGAGAGVLDEDISTATQDQLQAWERILRVTGGAVVPEKSFFWTMNFVKDKLQVRQVLPPLSVADCHGSQGLVPHVLASEAKRTLGLLITPSGDWKAQKLKLRKVMEEWSEACKVAGLSRQDAMIELKTRVLPRVLYGLEATSFSHGDCKYIMAPALQTGLQVCGVTRSLPRPIVFGPASLLGLDLTDMYVVQGVRHLQVLECYGPLNPDGILTGQLLRCAIEEAIVHVGLGGSLFTRKFSDYGMLIKDGWMKTLWRFCSEYEVEVQDWIPHSPILREGDRYLMEVVRAVIPQKDSSSFLSVNRCRRFLRVLTLTEITQGNGRFVRKDALEGRRNQWCQRFGCLFTESYPASGDWKIWREVLGKIFPLQGSLGRWVAGAKWNSFTNFLEDELYLRQPLGWTRHKLVDSRSRHKRYSLVGDELDDLPTQHVLYLIVEQCSNGLVGSGARSSIETLPGEEVLPELYSETFSCDDIVSNDMITICSDGSFKNDRGTASWIVVTPEGAKGEDVLVPDGTHSAYRSELCGLLGGLRYLNSLSNPPSKVRILCDGKSALEVSFSVYPLQPASPQLDILQGIRACRASLGLKGVELCPVHIKGHSDDHVPLASLTFDQRLNIMMDHRAKQFWEKMDEQGWPVLGAPKLLGSCCVRIAQKVVNSSLIQTAIHERDLRHYWLDSKGIPETAEVDWNSIAKASRAIRRGKGVFLTKFFSGFCGVNRWRKKCGMAESDQCGRCLQAVESTEHLWVCRADEAKALKENKVDEIIGWIREQGGNTVFSRAMRSVLGAIRHHGEPAWATIPAEYREAFAAQQVIGWNNFLMGCWAIEWREGLRAEYASSNERRQPERMVAAIITRLWETSWDLWLGRNAAVYPSHVLSAEGELIPVDVRTTSLCRRTRRKKEAHSSRECMRRWLTTGSRRG